MVKLKDRVDGNVNDLKKRAWKELMDGRFTKEEFDKFVSHCDEILKTAKKEK